MREPCPAPQSTGAACDTDPNTRCAALAGALAWRGADLHGVAKATASPSRPTLGASQADLFVSPTCRLLSAMFEGLRDRGARCRTACIVTSTSSCKGAWSAARPTWGSLRL